MLLLIILYFTNQTPQCYWAMQRKLVMRFWLKLRRKIKTMKLRKKSTNINLWTNCGKFVQLENKIKVVYIFQYILKHF